MRGRSVAPAAPERLSQELIERGLQYYVSGRYATIAGFLVAANLFHHAIEMLLKGCLARTHTERQLKTLRHDIRKAWRLFKREANDPILDQLDTTVAKLDKFEDIRYPDRQHGMFIVIYFGPTPGKSKGMGSERHYELSVKEVDELVKAIFHHSGFDPLFFAVGFRSEEAKQFFSQWNEHPIWK